MRRHVLLVAALAATVSLSATAGVSADHSLSVTVDKAPIVPDGTTAGAVTDFVVTFADRDPDVPGIDLKAGGTISVTLPPGFVQVDPAAGMLLATLQGWPQSPRLPFPAASYDAATNTITATTSFDYGYISPANPGPKQIHLILLGFRNPGPDEYPVGLEIQPDPGDPATLTGVGTVHIIPKVRPSIQAISVINPGPPPPFPNSIYQTVGVGEMPLRWGFYLWEKGGDPFLGVELVRKNTNHYTMVDDRGRSVGQVKIDAPAGATGHWIDADASAPAFGAVLGIPTGLLIARFHPDPTATGDYEIEWRINNGTTQSMFVTVAP